MTALNAVQCATSLLYQLFSWVFLRIIPARAGAKVLPALYLAYLGLFAMSELERVRSARRTKSGRAGSSGVQRSNGSKVTVSVEGVKRSGLGMQLESARSTNSDGALASPKAAAVNGHSSSSRTAAKTSLFKSARPLMRALISLPTRSARLNLLPLLVNTLLLCWSLDLLYTPSYFFASEDLTFARVGAVGPDMAKLTIRVPSTKPTSDPVQVAFQPVSLAEADPTYSASFVTKAVDDYVKTITLDHLSPGVAYHYVIPAIGVEGTFTTAPDPVLARSTGSHFSFLSTSCIKPNYPYAPPRLLADFSSKSRLAIPGFEQLSKWLAEQQMKPAFITLLGDQVYADTPVGGKTDSWFRRLYRQLYRNEHFQRVLAELPAVAVWDDHEIYNNFAGEGHAEDFEGFKEASSAFEIYLGAGNPHDGRDGKLWYDFDYGDVSVFAMDTRPHRSNEWLADDENKTMLGHEQKADLIAWLHEMNETATFKFILSSVPFTSLWGPPDGHLDTWASYLHERDELMAIIDNVPNVIFLSGDRHEFAAVQLRGKVYEFSTSPLSQFTVPYTWTLKADRTRYLPLIAGESETGGINVEDGPAGKTQVKGEPEEVLLKYMPDGNVKWGRLEVDTRDPAKPRVDFELWIDSKLAGSYQIIGDPIRRSSAAGGAGARVKSLLEDLASQARQLF